MSTRADTRRPSLRTPRSRLSAALFAPQIPPQTLRMASRGTESPAAGREAPALERGVDDLERAAAPPAGRASLVREPRKLDRDRVRRRLGHQCVTMTTIPVVSAPTTCARPASTVPTSLRADMSRMGTTTTAPGSGVGLLEPKIRPRLCTARTLPFGCSTNVRPLSPRYDTPPAALR